jgi:hypothetical protein
MLGFSLLFIFLGAFLVFYGIWYTFVTIVNVLQKGKYTPFVLGLSSILVSIGITLFMLGVLL